MSICQMTFNPIQMESCICFQVSARRSFSNRPEPVAYQFHKKIQSFVTSYHIILAEFSSRFDSEITISIWIRSTYSTFWQHWQSNSYRGLYLIENHLFAFQNQIWTFDSCRDTNLCYFILMFLISWWIRHQPTILFRHVSIPTWKYLYRCGCLAKSWRCENRNFQVNVKC